MESNPSHDALRSHSERTFQQQQFARLKKRKKKTSHDANPIFNRILLTLSHENR